jgi:hypothetical protein
VQRLEQLAQSLGGTTPATPSANLAPQAPSSPITRLLTSFANVLNFLQPAATVAPTAAPASATPAGTPASAPSVADQLKVFLTTLAQSLRSGEPLSPTGSRVNHSV